MNIAFTIPLAVVIVLSYSRLYSIIDHAISMTIDPKRSNYKRYDYYRHYIMHNYIWITLLIVIQNVIVSNMMLRLFVTLLNIKLLEYSYNRVNMMWGAAAGSMFRYPCWYSTGYCFTTMNDAVNGRRQFALLLLEVMVAISPCV